MNIKTVKAPVITIPDAEGREHTGRYVSHKKMGDGFLSTVILERPNGSRFRLIALTLTIHIALEESQWTI